MRKHLSAAAVLVFTITTAASAAETPTAAPTEELHIRYQVSRALLRAVSERTLKRHKDLDRNSWIAEAYFRPSGLLRALSRAEQHERSEFRIRDNAVRVLNHHSRRSGHRPHQRKAVFDYDAAQAHFESDGGEHHTAIALSADTTILDYAMLPFAFMRHGLRARDAARMIASLEGRNFHLSNGKRLAHYRVVSVRDESLKTKFGVLQTHAIHLARATHPERTLTLWTAPAYHNLMVQLREERASETTLFRLTWYSAPPVTLIFP